MTGVFDKERLMTGYKQTLKAINENRADTVYLAENCDDKIRLTVENTASAANVSILYIKSMRELGGMCGIAVGASCAVVLK